MSFAGSPRILITGAHGFVGRHLVRRLADVSPDAELVLADRHAGPAPLRGRSVTIDITDTAAVEKLIAAEQPSHLVHLAAIAAVTEATGDAKQAQAINFGGVRNVALAIIRSAPACRLLFCSSAEVYGSSFKAGYALDETAPLQPVNAYGAAKAEADSLLGEMARDGLKVVRLRPVNHTGPGQGTQFVVPDFSSQIARIERGQQPPVIRVGNLSNSRDFLDVRDVVDAYAKTLLAFDDIPNGCAMNVASGSAIVIRTVLDHLLALSSRPIEVKEDPALFRTSDTPVVVCDSSLARRLLAWQPRYHFADTLRDVLDYWRTRA